MTWSSDNAAFADFVTWNPCLGMEVGITRQITEKTNGYDYTRIPEPFPPANEKMDLLTAEQEGFSYNLPKEVYYCGKR